jgi:hypothetical protein
VRDESTTDVRIVLEIKRDADPALVMAYLYKHTPLQTNFKVNITCLVPTAPAQPRGPGRRRAAAHLKEMLRTSSTSASSDVTKPPLRVRAEPSCSAGSTSSRASRRSSTRSTR